MIRNRYRKRPRKRYTKYKRGKALLTIPALIAGALAVGKAVHLGSKLIKKLRK